MARAGGGGAAALARRALAALALLASGAALWEVFRNGALSSLPEFPADLFSGGADTAESAGGVGGVGAESPLDAPAAESAVTKFLTAKNPAETSRIFSASIPQAAIPAAAAPAEPAAPRPPA